MTKMVTYLCPGTDSHPAHSFKHLHHPSIEADPLPRFCGQCGFDSQGVTLEQPLGAPHIAKSIKGVVDNMHKEMEAGADFRAAMAVEKFGLTPEEAAVMKETNSQDSLRQGDTSEAPVVNDVSRMIEAAPQNFGFRGGEGLGYSGNTSGGWNGYNGQGPTYPNAGANAQKIVRSLHSKTGGTSSSLPALETTNPGYKQRVS